LFNNAKAYGDKLWVIVNSDLQRKLKGSKEFMNEDERMQIVSSLKMVNLTMVSIDEDSTVIETIRALYTKAISKDPKYKLAFANGGDQTNDSIPEAAICRHLGIELIENLGNKIQSSSWLLKK
jgi:glycerol-3-phosphate cytidylyltransferase-like family protein